MELVHEVLGLVQQVLLDLPDDLHHVGVEDRRFGLVLLQLLPRPQHVGPCWLSQDSLKPSVLDQVVLGALVDQHLVQASFQLHHHAKDEGNT